MRRRVIFIAVVLSLALVAIGFVVFSRAGRGTRELPADISFKDLLREYANERDQLQRAYKSAHSLEERRQIHEQEPELAERYARHAVEVIRQHPHDPHAVEAMLWLSTLPDSVPGIEELQGQAIQLVLPEHLEDKGLVNASRDLVAGAQGAGAERLLRAFQEKTPDRTLRGMAGFWLAESLHTQSERLYGLGKEAEAEGQSQESDKVLQQLEKEYPDLKLGQTTLGQLAANVRRAYEKLRLGKPAPEIVGEDIDGKPLRLSEHRGKVVMISFWAFWCGPCRSLFPHEKGLVQRWQGQPFVLLGVNGDQDREATRQEVRVQGLAWRSWWNGGPGGPITREWNVSTWPTVYLVDRRGNLRYKASPVQSPGELDEAIERLMQEPESGTQAAADRGQSR
jgi:thiol-disulfide isomerase/thioredoxin/TolA-binding protein